MRWFNYLGLASLGLASYLTYQVPDSQTTPTPVPTTIAPMKFFTDKCSRCHGAVESEQNTAFEDEMNLDRLDRRVQKMVEGPARSSLTKQELNALVALVGNRQQRHLFLSWTAQKDQSISGETLSGTTILATANGKNLEIKVKDNSWTIAMPKDVKPNQIVLTATRGKLKTSLDLSKNAFTPAF